MTQPLEGMALVRALYAAEVGMATEKLGRLEALHREMAYAAVRRVNLAQLLISRLSWYGYELKPPPANAVKMALEQEFREAMEQYSEWYRGHGNIQQSAISNRAMAVKEGRLK